MSRIKEIDFEKLTTRQREVNDAIASSPRGGVRGPLAIWLHRPELADLAQALGCYCRYETLLSPKLSELAILVTARVWNSEYEWQVHKKHALRAGLSATVIEAIRNGDTPAFETKEEALVYNFSLTTQRDRKVPQSIFDDVVALLGKEAVVDLTGLLGYYGLISMTINVFEVNPPDPDNRELD